MDLRGKKIEEGYFNLVTIEGDNVASSGALQNGQGTNVGNISVGGLSFNNTDSELKLPTGTTAQRPATPQAGYVRWNTTEGRLEVFDGTYWNLVTGLTISYPIGTTWATTTNLPVNLGLVGGVGTISSTLSFGGVTASGQPFTTASYIWSGSSWASTSSLNNAVADTAEFGDASNAISATGNNGITPNVSIVESWNGSSWATTTSTSVAKRGVNGCGTSTAGLIAGGYTNAAISNTDLWNGSSWSTTSALNNAGYSGTIIGSQSEALLVNMSAGGQTEKWNGSSWATTSDTNANSGSNAGAGTVDLCIIFGGFISYPTEITNTEYFNGSAWATTTAMVVARGNHAGTGDAENALSIGGGVTPASTTQIWS